MDQDGTPPPQPRTSSNPAAATRGRPPFAASSSTPAPVRGPTSSAMLLGTSSPANSRRRFSPSLYPPPSPPMSGRRLASGSGSSSSSPSPSRFRQEIPPPSPKAARGGRQRSTQALPSQSQSTVLSELASIRRVAAARATSQKLCEMRVVTLYGGRPLQQALPSWSAMYARSRLGTPPPSGSAPLVSRQRLQPPPPPPTDTLPPQPSRHSSFPGFATSASQQAQPSSSGVPPRPGGISSPAMQQQQAKSSFTDLAPLPGGSGFFSEFPLPASSQQPEAMSSFSDLAFHGGQPLQQALPTKSRVGEPASQQLQRSSSSGSGFPSPAVRQPQANSSFTDPPPLPGGAGIFSDLTSGSGIAPAASQQLQTKSSFTTLAPLPSGSGIAPAASQELQTKSSFTTLAPLPGGSRIAPAASQQLLQAKSSFTTLAPLPGGSLSGITPRHGEAAMFGSSSWSSSAQLAAPASNSDTMYGQGQPASDSELHPLPPSLQIRADEVMQFSQPSGNDSTFTDPEAATLHTPPVFQVKAEPVDIDTPCLLQPELISIDGDEEDEISALLRSFQWPNEPGSLYLEHTSTEDMLQLGGGGSSGGPSALGVVEGSGQSWKAMTMTPYNKVTTGTSIPWNCSDGSTSMPQQQIPQQQGDQFSMAFSDAAIHGQPSGNNILSGFGQQIQQNLQMPMMLSATDVLQLISKPGPSIRINADSSGQQGAAAMPAASSSSMFDQVNIGGGGTMNIGQGWPATPVAADQYGMFDNSGSRSSSAWAVVPDQMASKFNQMSIIGEGSLSNGKGWPAATPAPTFDITGSSSAWASMPWNTSSWAMENCSTPGPNLRLGAMEQPRLTIPRPRSVAAGASRSMSQRGAHGDIFSAAEIETIIKDKRLKEMVNADPKRVKRILNNRTSVAKLRPLGHAE